MLRKGDIIVSKDSNYGSWIIGLVTKAFKYRIHYLAIDPGGIYDDDVYPYYAQANEFIKVGRL